MRTDFVYIVGFYFLFLIQYLVAAGLFCFRFPKRKLFWLRLPAALLLCGGLALLWSEGAQEYVILLIARYLLLFCGAFAAVLFCFRVSMSAALFCVTGGYALQHFAQVCASSAFGALADAGAADVWLVAAYTAAFIVVYLAGYFIFAARMQRSETVIAGEKGIVLLSAAGCYAALSLVLRGAGRHAGPGGELRQVRLTLGERQTELTALVDTGNTLTDPATGRPVLVAEADCLAPLLPAGVRLGPEALEDPAGALEGLEGPWRRRFRLLPYRAVGVERGLLLALRLDKVQVGGEDRGAMLAALSPTPVSDGGNYRALIGPE